MLLFGCFFRFSFVPKGIHFGQGHVAEVAAQFLGAEFQPGEAALELGVGLLQGRVGIEMIQAGRIDDRKDEIAQFGFLALFRAVLQFGAEFAEFLGHLVPDILFLFPVEAHSAGLVLHPVGLDQGRESVRNAGKHGLVAVLFLALELLPVLDHLARRLGLHVAIDVGVPIDQFVAKHVAHVGNVKVARFGADLRIEDDVQQQVAQFLGNVVHVVRQDGVGQFISFFDGIGAEGIEGLLAVPGALFAQVVHDVQESGESLQFFFSFHRRKITKFLNFAG